MTACSLTEIKGKEYIFTFGDGRLLSTLNRQRVGSMHLSDLEGLDSRD